MTRRVNRNPLRTVLDHGVNEYGVLVEHLDCGHTIHVPQDIYGHTNAEKRRCRLCGIAQRNHETAKLEEKP